MDDSTREVLEKLDLPGVHPLSLEDFERNDDLLLSAKQNRSRIEYYFTCTPSLPLYILNNRPDVDLITYLDADLFFFASPIPLFEELGDASIGLIGHRFPSRLKYREVRSGIYNVGWLSFRRDMNGLASLQWWRDRCIEWCYDRPENGRFADQKYLDDWPTRFENVVVLKNKGTNVAPWNLGNHDVTCQDGDTVLIDGEPLIFFHFHGLKKMTSWWYDPGWRGHGARPGPELRGQVYVPYVQTLLQVSRELLPGLTVPNVPGLTREVRPNSTMRSVIGNFRKLLSIGKSILKRQFIFIINGRSIF